MAEGLSATFIGGHAADIIEKLPEPRWVLPENASGRKADHVHCETTDSADPGVRLNETPALPNSATSAVVRCTRSTPLHIARSHPRAVAAPAHVRTRAREARIAAPREHMAPA